MNISRFTDYSLRILIYLAINKNTNEIKTIKEIAECYGVSKNHLMKVVQQLNAQGYINSTRGKNGGIKLNHAAEQINIGKLVRSFEGKSALVECFGENNFCIITPACQLKKVLSHAIESFFNCLDQYTLADLINGPNKAVLSKILITSDY